MASTGDKNVDAVVEEEMTEAIGVVKDIIETNFPNADRETVERLAVAIPLTLLPIISALIIKGMMARSQEAFPDGTQEG